MEQVSRLRRRGGEPTLQLGARGVVPDARDRVSAEVRGGAAGDEIRARRGSRARRNRGTLDVDDAIRSDVAQPRHTAVREADDE